MNTIEFKTLKSQVQHCLETYPQTRNSDIDLTQKVWEIFFGELMTHHVGFGSPVVQVKDLHILPREDHISRVRRHFQEQKLYLPTSWEVAKQRGIEEFEWKKALGYHMADNSGQLTFA